MKVCLNSLTPSTPARLLLCLRVVCNCRLQGAISGCIKQDDLVWYWSSAIRIYRNIQYIAKWGKKNKKILSLYYF